MEPEVEDRDRHEEEHGRISGTVPQIVSKLEDPHRLDLLKPAQTLAQAEIGRGMNVVDIGAGSGVFAFEVANMPDTSVVAIDAKTDMLDYLSAKAREQGLENIKLLHASSVPYPIGSSSIDAVLMVHVLHEFNPEDREAVAAEIERILKPGGKFLLIDFPADSEVSGPPVNVRVSRDEADRLFTETGLVVHKQLEFGSDFYGVVYQKRS